MNRILVYLLLAALWAPASLDAAPKRNQPRAVKEQAPGSSKPDAKPGRVFEYEKKEVAEILRTLAREAGIDLVISARIDSEGLTVTLRVENKTPRQVIEIIVKANGLQMDELQGVYYIKHQNDHPTSELFHEQFVMEYEARPDAARKVARAKRALFDALLAANFTPEEALQLVITHEELPPSKPPQ